MQRPDRWWMRSLLAMLLAWLGVLLCVGVWAWCGAPWRNLQAPELPVYDLPVERVLQVPHGAWYSPEPCLNSDVPIVRLREIAPRQYELLYWGNPVRPRYAYRVRNIMSGETVLCSADGTPEAERALPVPCPRRADKSLPLQPKQALGLLRAAPGGLCGVRVEVLDADTGIILCRSEYLLICPHADQRYLTP